MYPQRQKAFGKIENPLETTYTRRKAPSELRMEANFLKPTSACTDICRTHREGQDRGSQGGGTKPPFGACGIAACTQHPRDLETVYWN